MKVLDVKTTEANEFNSAVIELDANDVWFFHNFNVALQAYIQEQAIKKGN